jgi:glycosyltransferase involved in cell wall biosynthesis
MKIALVGPGIMSIPPIGWGAVEILIWDYYNVLRKLGHEIDIVNIIRQNTWEQSIPNSNYSLNLISVLNSKDYDFIHIHYDCLFHIMPKLKCKKIAITSHYPYIDQIGKHAGDGYTNIFHFLVNQQKYYNFVLADKDYKTFLNCGANPFFLKQMKNGINSSLFHFEQNAVLNKTIYLGKISPRKKQAIYQQLENIDFVGNCEDSNFNIQNKNFLGEWNREKIYKELTNYSNLLLISEGEADPLVVKEALVSGLGIVINQNSAANLDIRDFITIITDDKINDLNYIQQKVNDNKLISRNKREEIRNYGIMKFSLETIADKYIEYISDYDN